jgi:hypothetical protein
LCQKIEADHTPETLFSHVETKSRYNRASPV